ncbi:hypothetical protein M885DRAFT_509609 [Pelagophyceae sp. CCMP2097]|nr:hypothetical protein M885DRAFT_509609 [Pelagophyceae sp. CCMP2097]
MCRLFTALCCLRLSNSLQWPSLQPQRLLPPAARLALDPNAMVQMRAEASADAKTVGAALVWEESFRGADVAAAVFAAVAGGQNAFVAFPNLRDAQMLTKLCVVFQSHAELGVFSAEVAHHPKSVVSQLALTFHREAPQPRGDGAATDAPNAVPTTMPTAVATRMPTAGPTAVPTADVLADAAVADAVRRTEEWVDGFLGKNNLCPYTRSTTQAAVGLASVGVAPGGVVVRVQDAADAATVAAAFWACTADLLAAPEKEAATALLVLPCFDGDFLAFSKICDGVVEDSVGAVCGADVIGRAWFHPLYTANDVGHSTVVAGHALPHDMVLDFCTRQASAAAAPLTFQRVAGANDLVRRTPHATINILRRSQLIAAAAYEAALPMTPVANRVYVRNVQTLLRNTAAEET